MVIERFEGTGRMSRAVRYDGTLYLCGQTSRDGSCVKAQTKEVLNKVEELLCKYGSDKESILSATIYLKDMNDFSAMNEIWDSWVIKGSEPARACVKTELASPEILVEISVIAAVKQ
ncbi:MAG: RidA family protein [Clostridiaceae bacterium]|nr:RidA family protein [Clostridiaceae bacterium]